MAGPCGWTVEQCGCDCYGGYSPAQRERAATLAIGHMWKATGRRYGLCEVTVIVCDGGVADPLYQTYPVDGYDPGSGMGLAPYIAIAGGWRNRAAGCGSGCCGGTACEVALEGPVYSVSGVTVAGAAVAADAYEIHDRTLLVRTDGECWPTCGTVVPPYGMTVDYVRGTPVPADVQAAVEQLLCQYARACTGGDCVLPARLTSLARQGVDITVAEAPTDGSDWWRTGIDAVDRVIAADNPRHLTAGPQVFSPDLPAHRVVTWAGSS
jgi:hypothetical protein